MGFPGATIYEAAPKLERKYRKISVVTNTGGGETEGPHNITRQIGNYIEKTKTDKFTIDVITSKPDSSIGKIGKKYGFVLQLKGREENERSEKYRDIGIMQDIYELGSLATLQGISQMLCENSEPQKFFEIMEKELPRIGSMVDEFVTSDMYSSLIDDIESRAHVFCGGRVVAGEVSKMLAIRLAHVKHFLGDEVYMIGGANTPRPRARDIAIFTSFSGGKIVYPGETREERSSIVKWAEDYRNLGVKVYSMIGTEDSPLERASDYSILLKEEKRDGTPRWFYVYTAFSQSPIAASICERLTERGMELPPELLRYQHTIAE
jgi:6-phospho-3-hexuloisomerase